MNARLSTIIAQIKEQDKVTVRDLARLFSVSEMTIRRDLDVLEKQGLVVRVYGGCMAADRFGAGTAVESQPETNVDTKSSLGQLAASLVKPGQTLMLNAGCSEYELVKYLPRDHSVTVVTSSLSIALELEETPINVLLLGGMVRKQVSLACGPMTEKALDQFRVDIVFATCDGVDSRDGFYMSDVQLSSLGQTMLRVSDKVVLLAESEKFGKRALVRFAEPQEIDVLVTDDGISDSDRACLAERGVSILTASISEPQSECISEECFV